MPAYIRSVTRYDDKHKVLFIVGLLRGRALEWAQAEDLRNPLASRTLTGFLRDLRSVFDLPHDQGTVTERILQIRQGGESVADYSIRFKTLAAEAGWDEGALKGIFCQGLHPGIRSELAWRGESMGLQELIYAAIRLDNVRRNVIPERAAGRSAPAPQEAVARWRTPPPQAQLTRPLPQRAVVSEQEPMQVGESHLRPEERERRTQERRCYYCGEAPHLIRSSPVLAIF